MSKNLMRCLDKLQLIASIEDEALRSALLTQISCKNNIYKAMQEIAKNVVKRNVPLTIKQKRKLDKYKKVIKRLSCDNKNLKTRKKLFSQIGGFLPALLPAIASVLGPIIVEQILKK